MVELSVHIDASPERIWRELIDVERWPEWTASMTRVELLDTGDLAVGHRARITQPKMRPMVWKVTRFEPLHSFAWKTRTGAVSVTGDHVITTSEGGGADVRLSIEERGLLGPLVRLLTRKTTRRYLEMEAQGLKRRCES
jgi:hypothetical protein